MVLLTGHKINSKIIVHLNKKYIRSMFEKQVHLHNNHKRDPNTEQKVKNLKPFSRKNINYFMLNRKEKHKIL